MSVIIFLSNFICKKENALILLIKECQIIQRMFANELCAEQLAVKANYYEDVRDMKNLSTQSFEIIQKSIN